MASGNPPLSSDLRMPEDTKHKGDNSVQQGSEVPLELGIGPGSTETNANPGNLLGYVEYSNSNSVTNEAHDTSDAGVVAGRVEDNVNVSVTNNSPSPDVTNEETVGNKNEKGLGNISVTNDVQSPDGTNEETTGNKNEKGLGNISVTNDVQSPDVTNEETVGNTNEKGLGNISVTNDVQSPDGTNEETTGNGTEKEEVMNKRVDKIQDDTQTSGVTGVGDMEKEFAVQDKPQSPVLSDKSAQGDKRVTFFSTENDVGQSGPPPKTNALPEGALILKQELEQMRLEDEKEAKLEKEKKKSELAKLKAKMTKAHAKRTISVDINSDLYKKFIGQELAKEDVIALKDERDRRKVETKQMIHEVDIKHGVRERRKAGSVNKLLRKLEREAQLQAKNDEITRELTRDEVQDLHIAFDMFDTKRRGLITISDLKRLMKMLKFTTGRGALKDLISNLDKTKRGIADFNDFLQLVVLGQGDGPDPYEEIVQGFNLIDAEGKGYITFDDLRVAADATDATFSNSMLREMMTEADCTGDGRISKREFVKIMLDTNRYRAIKKSMFS